MNEDNEDFDTDVIIVGTGPTGGTAALALATYGVDVEVVNRWNWLANTPRAHITNQRAMEVFRDLGIEQQIIERAIEWDLIGDMTFATSLTGTELARLKTWGTGDARRSDYLLGSPCPLVDIGQPHVEAVLVDTAAARGASFSFNIEYLRHEQDDTGVTVHLQDRRTGVTWSRRARYLIGADGARSQIAEEIGLEIVGEHARAGQIYARFTADLSHLVENRPSTLHYIVSSAGSFGEIGLGVLRAVRPWDQWMAGWGFDINAGEPDLDHDHALERIRTLVGDPDLEADIEWVFPWYVNQAHATTYSKGRVFCGGDAVHRHPPSSGLGSNTCIQDGFNLAWKLAFVINGWAGPELLETYSDERAPVGAQIVARANQSRVDFAPLRAAFATDDGDTWAKLSAPTPEGAKTRAALADALRLKSFEFNAQGVELNQRYTSRAVVAEPDATEETWVRDPQLHLQPTSRPGAKLPHVWLVDHDGNRVSTLDLVGHGQISVLTGLAGTAWTDAVAELDLPFLRPVTVGELGRQDLYGTWDQAREMDEAGAVIVRPDGFVAWRHQQAVYDQSEARTLLVDALTAVLDLSQDALLATRSVQTTERTVGTQPVVLDATAQTGD